MLQFLSGIDSSLNINNEISEAIFLRENLMSTGIGLGIAVPHIRSSKIKNITMILGVSRKPITDYVSIDGKPVHIIAMIIAKSDQHAEHIRLLADITTALKSQETRVELLNAKTNTDIYNIITKNL